MGDNSLHVVAVPYALSRVEYDGLNALRLDRNGQISIVAGRGNYTAHVHAAGFSPLVPIALSRSQTADLSVITPIDLLVLGLTGLAIVAVLLAVGRGRQRLLRLLAHPVK